MVDPLYLCLDQGGSSSRALVFDSRGHCVARAQQSVETTRPQPSRVEQAPEAVVESLFVVANQALEQLTVRGRARLVSAGLATQRSSMLCWQRDSKRTLTPILSWQDTRAAEWLAAQRWSSSEIHRITGLMPNAHFGVSKMRWCLDHLDVVKAAAQAQHLVMGPLASYLAQCLTNGSEPLVDPANASRTLLMNLVNLDWDDTLLQRANIERRWLPTVCPSLSDFGTIDLDSRRIPLSLVNGDQSAAAFALGAPKPGSRYINVGTGAFVFQPLPKPITATALLSSITFRGSTSHYVLEGTVNGAGSAINQFVADKRIPDVAVAVEEALATKASGMIFLNGVGGLGSPDWQADFPSRFIGWGDEKAQLRAILESIGFLLMRNMAAMDDAGLEAKALVMSGGLSASDRFCRLVCDLSGYSVERPANPEATARGTAFLLAGMPSDWSQPPSDCFVPQDNPGLLDRFARWQMMMEQTLMLG